MELFINHMYFSSDNLKLASTYKLSHPKIYVIYKLFLENKEIIISYFYQQLQQQFDEVLQIKIDKEKKRKNMIKITALFNFINYLFVMILHHSIIMHIKQIDDALPSPYLIVLQNKIDYSISDFHTVVHKKLTNIKIKGTNKFKKRLPNLVLNFCPSFCIFGNYWDKNKVPTFNTFERLDEQWKISILFSFIVHQIAKIINNFFLSVFMAKKSNFDEKY
ncbi:hypothetical protein RFI_00096 [Reticulomyxa filosa]|uniref:Uncharacterized protein n=1 Tax=Reticulomyxa filosa TaxID=46433 RepID=X6PFI5_RETFI|nr:hypothetical protein RFI_00096 [Reticulomyxa filosa]|eukprot:ETO36966.1 hypothetical protein RFI_00096 [Reticulomyxa filosa]